MLILAALVNLPQTIAEGIDSRLRIADPQTSLSRFVGYPGDAKRDVFRPNTNFWARGIDFSCASPWNSDRGQLKAGTLVSKRHVVFAKHFPIAPGSRIVFVTTDGGICPCRIKATKPLERGDIVVGALDYEVTPNVHPAKILPLDYEKWIGNGKGLPTVTLTQREQAYVNDLGAIQTNAAIRAITSRVPLDDLRAKFSGKLITGDSGNPAFLVVGNEPILLYCVTMGGPGTGTAIHRNREAIQQAMDELCPGYKLESFDFSKVAEAKQ